MVGQVVGIVLGITGAVVPVQGEGVHDPVKDENDPAVSQLAETDPVKPVAQPRVQLLPAG